MKTLLLASALGLTTLWAASATAYVVFHDEVIARFLRREQAMQQGYEARLGTLQRALDTSSADRGAIAARLEALAERQALIETRQGRIGELAGVPLPAMPAEEPPAAAAPPPAEPNLELRTRGGDRAESEARVERRLSGLERRLGQLSDSPSQAVGAIGQRAGRNAVRYRALILGVGIDPNRFIKADKPLDGIGGPLVPVSADAFDVSVFEAKRQIGIETQLRRLAGALPLRAPLRGETVQTSDFGIRLDPFTRGVAMHTGIDFKADKGVPARATAAGRVTAVDYAGGYGNMVEVDHGHGLVTRYAHLSGYAVREGDTIAAGAVVGYVGSTGRSTGTHLHYETRIDGEPVDPQRFLKAGAQLVFPE